MLYAVVLLASALLSCATVLAANGLRKELRAVSEAVSGFWGTKTAETTAFVPLDEILAEQALANPFSSELVFDTDEEASG